MQRQLSANCMEGYLFCFPFWCCLLVQFSIQFIVCYLLSTYHTQWCGCNWWRRLAFNFHLYVPLALGSMLTCYSCTATRSASSGLAGVMWRGVYITNSILIFLVVGMREVGCSCFSLSQSVRCTVVRVMNAFNGKCHFSGSSSSGTPEPIFKKFCEVDYVSDPTPQANIWSVGPKGACLHIH